MKRKSADGERGRRTCACFPGGRLMMIDKNAMQKACLDLEQDMTAFLDALVRFDSISSYEGPAMEWLYDQFSQVADVCEKVVVPESIVDDPDYSFRMGEQPYAGRPNLRVVMKGDGSGKSVLMNAHSDVVPPSQGHERPFDPFVENGVMFGRGTCDDKGQIAVVWTLFKAMKKLGVRPKGDVIFHIVIEEETGGNGTLVMIRTGEKADCCLNLEPAQNNVLAAVRGAVWFTGTVYGRAGHSGSSQTTVSALKMAIEAMNIIEEYNGDVLKATHGDNPLFLQFKNPMPVTFGILNAGDWPAMAPQKAEFKGVFGLLSTKKEEIMREMEHRVRTRGPEWLKDPANFSISFQYRHDTCEVPADDPLVTKMIDSWKEVGVESIVSAAPYGADGWYYNNILGIPTICTGCGSIVHAHTSREQVVLRDITNEAAALMVFIGKWGGYRNA